MLLKLRIEVLKKKLDKSIEKYGLQHKETLKISKEVDKLINKYYKKQCK